MKVKQGDVVIGPDFIGGNDRRPFIVLNNEDHPFSAEECLVVLVTTTEREEAVELPDKKFREGRLPKDSYASPWTVTTLKNTVITEKLGELNSKTTKHIFEEVSSYIEVK